MDRPDLPLDVMAPGFLQDPAPAYAWLRARHPVCPLQRGGFLLTRHEDIRKALGSKDLGNTPSRFSVLHPGKATRHCAAHIASQTLPFLDGPDHRVLRQCLSRAFHEVLKTFDPVLRDNVRSTIGQWRGAQDVDLIQGPAREFACRAIAGFVGFQAEPAAVKDISDAFFRLFAPVRDAADFETTNDRLTAARTAMALALTDRRRDGAYCLLTRLSALQQAAPDLTDSHIVDNAILILADGVENIEAGIGTVMSVLTARDAPPTEAMVREIMRLDTPAQIIPRVCVNPITLHGQQIAANSPLFLSLGAANRDDTVIEDAARILPGRDRRDALTFGAGRHSCIGEPLAVAMITACCSAFHEAGAQVDALSATYQPVFGHRWIREVRISLPDA